MNADELKKITEKNATKIEEILDLCERNAGMGNLSISHFGYLETETISELGKLGFSVRKITGPIGENVFIISWA